MTHFNKHFVIPFAILGVILILVSIFAPIGVKIDKEFSQLISSDRYKKSAYKIYEYEAEEDILDPYGNPVPSGYIIVNEKRGTYFSTKYEYSKIDGEALYYCVMCNKLAVINRFNKLNE